MKKGQNFSVRVGEKGILYRLNGRFDRIVRLQEIDQSSVVIGQKILVEIVRFSKDFQIAWARKRTTSENKDFSYYGMHPTKIPNNLRTHATFTTEIRGRLAMVYVDANTPKNDEFWYIYVHGINKSGVLQATLVERLSSPEKCHKQISL